MLYEDIMSFRLNFTWCEINADIQSFSVFKLKGTMWNVLIISQEVGATQVVRMEKAAPMAWRRSQHKIRGCLESPTPSVGAPGGTATSKGTEGCVSSSAGRKACPLVFTSGSNGAVKGLFAFFPMLFLGQNWLSSPSPIVVIQGPWGQA